jgi:hypothetical protein
MIAVFPLSPKLFRPSDICVLAILGAAAKQDHERIPVPSAIDAIAWPHMNPKLADAFANGLNVAQIPSLNLP